MKMNVKIALLSIMSGALIVCSDSEKSKKNRYVLLKEEYIANYKMRGQDYAWQKLKEQTKDENPAAYAEHHIMAAATRQMHEEYLQKQEQDQR